MHFCLAIKTELKCWPFLKQKQMTEVHVISPDYHDVIVFLLFLLTQLQSKFSRLKLLFNHWTIQRLTAQSIVNLRSFNLTWSKLTSDLNRCRISPSREVSLLGAWDVVRSTLRHTTLESAICLRLYAGAPQLLRAFSPALSANSSMRGLRLLTVVSRELLSSRCFLSAGVSVCAFSVSAFSHSCAAASVKRKQTIHINSSKYNFYFINLLTFRQSLPRTENSHRYEKVGNLVKPLVPIH